MSIGFFQTFKVSVVESLEKTEIYSDTNDISSYILREQKYRQDGYKALLFAQPASTSIRDTGSENVQSLHIIWCYLMRSHVFQI